MKKAIDYLKEIDNIPEVCEYTFEEVVDFINQARKDVLDELKTTKSLRSRFTHPHDTVHKEDIEELKDEIQ